MAIFLSLFFRPCLASPAGPARLSMTPKTGLFGGCVYMLAGWDISIQGRWLSLTILLSREKKPDDHQTTPPLAPQVFMDLFRPRRLTTWSTALQSSRPTFFLKIISRCLGCVNSSIFLETNLLDAGCGWCWPSEIQQREKEIWIEYQVVQLGIFCPAFWPSRVLSGRQLDYDSHLDGIVSSSGSSSFQVFLSGWVSTLFLVSDFNQLGQLARRMSAGQAR